jgi:hypothetical protein
VTAVDGSTYGFRRLSKALAYSSPRARPTTVISSATVVHARRRISSIFLRLADALAHPCEVSQFHRSFVDQMMRIACTQIIPSGVQSQEGGEIHNNAMPIRTVSAAGPSRPPRLRSGNPMATSCPTVVFHFASVVTGTPMRMFGEIFAQARHQHLAAQI